MHATLSLHTTIYPYVITTYPSSIILPLLYHCILLYPHIPLIYHCMLLYHYICIIYHCILLYYHIPILYHFTPTLSLHTSNLSLHATLSLHTTIYPYLINHIPILYHFTPTLSLHATLSPHTHNLSLHTTLSLQTTLLTILSLHAKPPYNNRTLVPLPWQHIGPFMMRVNWSLYHLLFFRLNDKGTNMLASFSMITHWPLYNDSKFVPFTITANWSPVTWQQICALYHNSKLVPCNMTANLFPLP